MRARDEVWRARSFHALTVEVGTRQFAVNGQPFEAPIEIISGRISADEDGRRFAVFAPAQGKVGVVYREGAGCVLLPPMPEAGRGMAAVFGGEVFCSGGNEDGSRTTITVFDALTLQTVRTFRARFASMGILRVLGAEEILSTDDVIAPVMVGDVRFWYLHGDRGCRIGQVEVIEPGGVKESGTVGLVSPTGEIQIVALTPTWDGYTNMPPYIAVSPSGEVRIAIQDPDGRRRAPESNEIRLRSDYHLPRLTEDPPVPSAGLPVQSNEDFVHGPGMGDPITLDLEPPADPPKAPEKYSRAWWDAYWDKLGPLKPPAWARRVIEKYRLV